MSISSVWPVSDSWPSPFRLVGVVLWPGRQRRPRRPPRGRRRRDRPCRATGAACGSSGRRRAGPRAAVVEAVEVGAGALLDPGAPQVDDGLGGGRRGPAGQALAHHQRHGILDGRVGAVGDLGVVAAVVAVLQHGGEVDADAVHAAGADRLDAHLLDGLEDRAGGLRLGQQAAVGGGIVAGEPQRHGIGVAAHDGGLARAELAGGLGQARLGGLAVADHARLVGRVGRPRAPACATWPACRRRRPA